MSEYDKLVRKEQQFRERAELVNFDNFEETKKYISKIRIKTLRKLLMCYYCIGMSFKNPSEYDMGIPYTINFIQNTLKCGKREAYDYLNTIFLISALGNQISDEITNSIIKNTLRMEENKNGLCKK